MADGVAIAVALLLADANVTALVPSAQISAGALGAGTRLPAIGVARISGTDLNLLSPGTTRHVTDRVQVMILAEDYPSQKDVEAAVKHCLADFVGSAAGLSNVTILTDHAGPDFMDEQASIRAGTIDFFIGYQETR